MGDRLQKFLLALRGAMVYCLDLSWRASPGYTLLRILVETLTPLIRIGLAFISKSVFDLLSQSALGVDIQREKLFYGIFLYVILSGTMTALSNWKGYATHQHGRLIQLKISEQQMERALTMPIACFDQPDSYNQLVSCTTDALSVSEGIWNLISLMSGFVTAVGGFLFLAQREPVFAWILLLLSIPSTLISAHYTKTLYQFTLDQISEERRAGIYQSLSMNPHYAQEIRLFHACSYLMSRFKRISKEIYDCRHQILRKRQLILSSLDVLPIFVIGGLSYMVILKILEGTMTIGDYSLYTNLMNQLWMGLGLVIASSLSLYENRLKFDHLREFLEQKDEGEEGGQILSEAIEAIEFRHVSFRYPETEKWVLKNVSFVLKKGQPTAIVGINGAGKSTLIKLIIGLYKPVEGQILVNGQPLTSWDKRSYRRAISVYFQGMENLPFTIKANFEFSAQTDGLANDVKEDDIINKLYQVASEELLDRSERGLEQPVTRVFDPEGLSLSVGQNQKFALARSLYRPHQLLILDEPTANVDAASEKRILDCFRDEAKDHLFLWVSHNFSSISFAQQILVLKDGVIVEAGSHEDLLQKDGVYAELYEFQMEKIRGEFSKNQRHS